MRSAAWALAAALASPVPGGAPGTGLPGMESDLLRMLQESRVEARLPAFVVDPVLSRVAGERARAVAALPFDDRMSPRGTIQSLAERAGIRRYRTISEHLEVQGGYPDPAEAAMDRWRKYREDWSHVLDPEQTRIGLGTARSDDGMIAFVAILLSEAPPPRDPRELESETEDAINRARVERGLPALAHSRELAAVARAHSEDMARRHYFAHRSPEDLGPADRVKADGMRYQAVAENIAVNSGVDSPVDVAVQGWLESRHHRENLLNAAYVLTGVGVASTDDGEIYFTQLFLTPPSERVPR